MGKIEETIIENYRHALKRNDLEQANRALGLIKNLKTQIENSGFVDYVSDSQVQSASTHYTPLIFEYDFDPEYMIIYSASKVINLTALESELFAYFEIRRSTHEKLVLISKQELRNIFSKKSDEAIRVALHRLRKKIEPDHQNPTVIINYQQKGYIFMGNPVNKNI
jgi:DNA-binding response OmpR family regulator